MATPYLRPSLRLQEATTVLQNLSLAKTKTLVFQLGVSRKDIQLIDARCDEDAAKKEMLLQKWLDGDAAASWERLVTAIVAMIARERLGTRSRNQKMLS